MPKYRELQGQFVVIRGYPAEGTLFQVFPVKPGEEITQGDPVQLDATGKVVKATDASKVIGFTNDGLEQPNAKAIGKVTVLMSPFIAETKKYDKTVSYVVGDKLTVNSSGILTKATGSAPVIGTVLAVDAANERLTFAYKV